MDHHLNSMLDGLGLHQPHGTSSQPSAGGPAALRPISPMAIHSKPMEHRHPHRLVLCFDGTGNKFHGNDGDSNILKIFRMLDRTASDQYHYYQPGIGTYVVSHNLSQTGPMDRFKSWCKKAKDSAIGSSFDQHVVGGYRFLMRFYSPGDEIYIFGFSRGAYIARFLAEMVDYVGLLSHGNEEMVAFAWKTFSQWQCRRSNATPAGLKKKREMYEFMSNFRETFSRPTEPIRFLGLFDTVNSVPRFETAWMKRSRFPYTARSSARVIRHAVSVDERRAKFRQDLIYQSCSDRGSQANGAQKKDDGRHHPVRAMTDTIRRNVRYHLHQSQPDGDAATAAAGAETLDAAPQQANETTAQQNTDHPHIRPARSYSTVKTTPSRGRPGNNHPSRLFPNETDRPQRFRTPSKSYSYTSRPISPASAQPAATASSPTGIDMAEYPSDDDEQYDIDDDEDEAQDVDEIWFAGGHGDIGGGWEAVPGTKSASHLPLLWMVHEASKAGLKFDGHKVKKMGCVQEILGDDGAAIAVVVDEEVVEDEVVDDEVMNNGDENDSEGMPPSREREEKQKKGGNSESDGDGGNGPATDDEVPVVPRIFIRSPTLSFVSSWSSKKKNKNKNKKRNGSPDGEDSTPKTEAPGPAPTTGTTMLNYIEAIRQAEAARLHDSLKLGGGLSTLAVISWRTMEYLPFRRMDLQPDGSWKPIRWPLPCGETRDIPADARIHGSVIRRMRLDEDYRPGNLIVGGGGRGMRRAPRHFGMGEWVCVERKGEIGEVWMRQDVVEKMGTAKDGEGEEKEKAVNGDGEAEGEGKGEGSETTGDLRRRSCKCDGE